MKSKITILFSLVFLLMLPLCRGQTTGGQWLPDDDTFSSATELQKFKNMKGVPFYVDRHTGRVLVDIGTNLTFTGTVNTGTNSWITGFAPGVTLPAFTATPSFNPVSSAVAPVYVQPLPSTNYTSGNLPISTNYVGGFTSICRGAISNDTSASYGIGDVYAAVFTCTNAARTAGGGVTWQSFKLFTGDDAQFDFEVFMFTQVPASLGLSNTVWSVSTADLASYCCGKMTSLDFPNGWSDLGTNRMFAADFVKSMQAAPGTNNFFMAIRTLTTATQGTNQPSVRLGFWPD